MNTAKDWLLLVLVKMELSTSTPLRQSSD